MAQELVYVASSALTGDRMRTRVCAPGVLQNLLAHDVEPGSRVSKRNLPKLPLDYASQRPPKESRDCFEDVAITGTSEPPVHRGTEGAYRPPYSSPPVLAG